MRSGKEVEAVWACDEKNGAQCRKDGAGNESTKGSKRGLPKEDGWTE